MNEITLLQNYLVLGGALFAIGLTGFLVRRNLIVMFLCAEMMLQGVSLTLVAWGRYHGNWQGQMLVVFVIAVAACEAGIALALVLMLCHRADGLDVMSWQQTREANRDPYIDRAIPEETVESTSWPTLTPAGKRPQTDPQEESYRSHV